MKNLKLLSLILVFTCIFCGNNLFGQGAYVNLHAGYGTNISSHNLFINSTHTSNSSTYERVNVSLGKGLNFGGAFGYMFNKNFGAELGFSYLLGGKSTGLDDFVGGKRDYTLSSNMLRINPSLVISSGLDGVNPYAKFGLILGTGSINYEVVDSDDGNIYKSKLKMDGGLAMGLNAAIGANFTFSDNMSLFGEINMINMSYAPTKGEIIEATYNGADELPNMTTFQKEIEFVESYTYSNNNPPADSEPRTQLKQKHPFGSFGLNLGLRISF